MVDVTDNVPLFVDDRESPRDVSADMGQETEIGLWQIFDPRRFHFPIYSRGRIVELWLSADEASKAGQYMAAVGRFLPTGDASAPPNEPTQPPIPNGRTLFDAGGERHHEMPSQRS